MSANPIHFEPGVFYPFDWLEEQLKPAMTLQTFLANLNLQCTGRNRLFQNGLLGDEILKAIQSTTAAEKPAQVPILPASVPNERRKRGRPRKNS